MCCAKQGGNAPRPRPCSASAAPPCTAKWNNWAFPSTKHPPLDPMPLHAAASRRGPSLRERGKVGARVKTDELWYKDAIFYELHVRTFADSNADGIGDFVGARQKLDYLKDLGATCLWL